MDLTNKYQEVSGKLKEILERKGHSQFVKVFFSEPVDVHKFQKHDVREVVFKTIFQNTGGVYVNTRKSNRGYDFWGVMRNNLDKIDRIIIVEENVKEQTFDDFKKKLYDEKTWCSLTEESVKDIKDQNGRFKFRSISTIFRKDVLEEIRAAFENKTDGHWYTYGTKRDFSVETKYENNEFKAWFSSEYSGCGNGDYYLLLNPTTAVFYETD